MIAKFLFATALSFLVSATSMAATSKYSHGLSSNQVSALSLNQVDQVYPVVSKYDSDTNSMLKMKFMTYDLGGSSDVSNLTEIYLSGFSFNEMSQAGALHFIAAVTKVKSVIRKSAGVYEIIAEELPVGADWPGPIDDFYVHSVKYVVEASKLSVDLRQLGSIEDGGSKQVTTPVKITRTVLN